MSALPATVPDQAPVPNLNPVWNILLDLAGFAAGGIAVPDIRHALDHLRTVRAGIQPAPDGQVPLGRPLRRLVRAKTAAAARAAGDPLRVPLAYGAVLPGTAVRIAPDGTVTLRLLGGHAEGTLEPRDRIPARHPAGRIRPWDRVWVAITGIFPDPDGGPIRLSVTQRDPAIPAGVLTYLCPDLAGRVRLRPVRRIPGAEAVIAVSAAPGWKGDPVAEAAGPKGERVRRAGAALGGERIRFVEDPKTERR